MTIWQRAIAIFLLMVFVPAAALAGASLRYCVGADGHSGIEFVASDADHHHDHKPATNGEAAVAVLSDGSDCTDRMLLTPAQQSARVEQVKLKTELEPVAPIVLACITAADDALTAVVPADISYSTALAGDPRLAVRETTVLLI